MNKYVIIVAGGSGKRMQSDIPKQFLLLNELPILMRTILQFYNFNNDIHIIVVLPKEQIENWKKLCENNNFIIEHTIIIGGKTRFHSVKNGLKQIKQNSLIAIHDGVRPLVSIDVIKRCFDTAKKKGNAIPVIKINESLRELSGDTNLAINREKFVIVQTPQVFHSKILISAYKKEYRKKFTDDASVVEYCREKINLVEGNIENIKITNKIDIKFAETLYVMGL